MRVKLLPVDEEQVIRKLYTACRTCYSSESPIAIFDTDDNCEKMLKLVSKVISSGHYSTIEHISRISNIRSIPIASYNSS